MNGQLWSWVLGLVGVLGFILAGKKIWWSWYINLGNQVVWLLYSVVTHQYGFLVATGVYTVVFTKNAIAWTKEHKAGSERTSYDATQDRDMVEEVPKEWRPFPPNDGKYVDIGREAFATSDSSVIFYRGMNYYKACDTLVGEKPGGGSSFCVKRVNHPGNYHEDYDGKLRLVLKPVIVRDAQGIFSNIKE